jgi:hypothetical protein
MQPTRLSRTLIVCSVVVFVAICQTAVAGTLCVNPAGFTRSPSPSGDSLTEYNESGLYRDLKAGLRCRAQ